MSQDTSIPFALANAGVRSLRPYEPGKPVEELERELGIENAIKLASNENPLGPSPKGVAAVQAALPSVSLYPDGNGYRLKQRLSRFHDQPIERITLGNGSNDILELLARVFLSPGHNAVFSQHAFAVYPIATQAVGADCHIAPANPADHAMPYGHDLDAMLAMVDDNTRVVFVANPNNPTGTWLKASELEAFVAALPKTTIAVIDEAYTEYVQQDNYPDASAWIERYPNLVVTRTFSKIYGLAGLRIGYSLSSPEIADLLNRVRQPFNANSLALAAAEAALDDVDHVQKSIAMNSAGLEQLVSAFAEMGLEWIPSVGNFICVKTGMPGQQVYEAMLRQGVILRPIGNYGLDDYVRVTVGSADENSRVINSLKQTLEAGS
jgi:histidinol-phosphate aminotransferase